MIKLQYDYFKINVRKDANNILYFLQWWQNLFSQKQSNSGSKAFLYLEINFFCIDQGTGLKRLKVLFQLQGLCSPTIQKYLSFMST